MQAGRYQYKFIVDGHWTYNPDSPLTRPDNMGNVNNFVQVSCGFIFGRRYVVTHTRFSPFDALELDA